MIKSMIFPTWDPNTSLSFLTSIVRVSTQMKMKEAMYSMNKTYQDHNLKIGVKKNLWKWRENIDADMWPLFYHSDMHFLTV